MNKIKKFPLAIALLVGLCLFTAASTYKQQVIAQTTVQAQTNPQAAVLQVVSKPQPRELAYTISVPQQAAPDAPLPPPAKAIEIEAPSVVKIGTLVEIDASKSHANSFAWLVTPSADGNIRIVDDGRRAYLTCGKPTTYTVTIAAASSDGMASIEQVVIAFEPYETPVPAAPKSPLAIAVSAGVDKVQSPLKDSEQSRLATVFNTVATMIEAGVIKTPEDVLSATAKLKKEALGDSAAAWAPFSDAVGSELNKMSEAKKLSTVEDHKAVWREIANALGAHTPC